MKPFVIPQEAACNLIKSLRWRHSLLNCIVGNVGARFWKGRRMHCTKKRWYLWFNVFFFFFLYIYILSMTFIHNVTERHHWMQFIRLHAASTGTTNVSLCFPQNCPQVVHCCWTVDLVVKDLGWTLCRQPASTTTWKFHRSYLVV